MIKELQKIQSELKAPKGQYNSFGKYKYRSCEDILEAVKPILAKYGCCLTLSDSIEQIGERIYLKAKATIKNADGETEGVTAFAREPEDKKGMDPSQITGTASSYARKYALNGLFCIDDTKEADTDEYTAQKKTEEARDSLIDEIKVKTVREVMKQKGFTTKEKEKEFFNKPVEKWTIQNFKTFMDWAEGKKG